MPGLVENHFPKDFCISSCFTCFYALWNIARCISYHFEKLCTCLISTMINYFYASLINYVRSWFDQLAEWFCGTYEELILFYVLLAFCRLFQHWIKGHSKKNKCVNETYSINDKCIKLSSFLWVKVSSCYIFGH